MNYLTPQQYEERTGIKYKTVLSWYAKNRFDGAYKDGIKVFIPDIQQNLALKDTFGVIDYTNSGRKTINIPVICDWCGHNFTKKPSKVFKRNFCEPEHQREYFRNNRADILGADKFVGVNSGMWKGNFCKYDSIHSWVEYHRGKALTCKECGATKEAGVIIEWSNDSGMYLRDLFDFTERCQPCHKSYDRANGFTRKNWFDEQGNRIAYPTEEQIVAYYQSKKGVLHG